MSRTPPTSRRANEILEALQEVLLLVEHDGSADEREGRCAVLLTLGEDEETRIPFRGRAVRRVYTFDRVAGPGIGHATSGDCEFSHARWTGHMAGCTLALLGHQPGTGASTAGRSDGGERGTP